MSTSKRIRAARGRLTLSMGRASGETTVLRVAYASSDSASVLNLYDRLLKAQETDGGEVAHISHNATTDRFLAAIHGAEEALDRLSNDPRRSPPQPDTSFGRRDGAC